VEKLIQLSEAIVEKVGTLFSWTTFLMVIVICIDVLLRYLFNFSFIWITEVEIYLFALCFLFGAGYALKHDKHVRVDLFYDQWSPVRRAWVDLLGTLLFLFPWCIVAIISCWKYAHFSFSFKEGSPQAGGLPALLIQGISLTLRSIQIIKGNSQES